LKQNLQLPLKHTSEESLRLKASSAELHRLIAKQQRKNELSRKQSVVRSANKKNIVYHNPELKSQIKSYQDCNQQLRWQLDLVQRQIYAIKTQQIAKLNMQLKEEQLVKDKLAVAIVDQRNMVQRLKADTAGIVVESNQFYLRAQAYSS